MAKPRAAESPSSGRTSMVGNILTGNAHKIITSYLNKRMGWKIS